LRHRTPTAIALVAVVALAPLLAIPVLGASTAAPATPAAVAGDPAVTPPKVVIVVGAVEGITPSYRNDADAIYAEAIKYTPNVTRIYSPNATWAKVKAAAQGASIFVYLGHGYGFPSPYRPAMSPDVQNGIGINAIGGVDDYDKKYYGETPIANEFRFAKDAIVLLNHLCYSAGGSESHHAEPTMSVARQRVDNYASGFIRAGARTVIAQSWTSGVIYTIRSIFTTNQTILNAWDNAPNKQGHVQPFVPVRNPAFEARVDPDNWTTGFHRSIVSASSHTTTQIRDGAGIPNTTGDAAPQLWSIDGPTALTPNFDGKTDTLSLVGRFSETVSWKVDIKNAGGDVVRTQTGTNHQAWLTWDARAGGQPAPDGDYTWNLHATDATGGTLDESGPISVGHPDVPSTGVLTFKPTTPTTTTVGSISYSLVFAGPVTAVNWSDFTRTGTSAGCVLATPVQGATAAEYTLTITGCGTGTVGLYLNAGMVRGADLAYGPAGPISAAKVTIDTSAPKVKAATPTLRTGVQLGGTSTSQPLLVTLGWTGTDSGSGIASYDVQRSYDGGAFTTIAGAQAASSLDLTMTPGHSYRFRVRARDKAGNVGAWSPSYTWYPVLTQQSSGALAWTGSWTAEANPTASNGWVKRTTAAGASVSYSFSGRAVAWVTTLRPDAGAVQVWIDGALAATVDTQADAVTARQVVFSRTWSGYGSHTIRLVNLATAGQPRADLDAFEVIR
jgi:hypothetical protein